MESTHSNQSVPPSEPSLRSRRRRAIEACSFCRRRKIKCNNERPVCINCKTYAQDCVYEPIGSKAREAGDTRHNRSRHRRSPEKSALNDGKDGRSHPGRLPQGDGRVDQLQEMDEGTASTNRSNGDIDRGDATGSSEARVAHILVSANGESSYHGRTSALFEDHFQDRSIGADQRPRMPDDWVERGLVAEAAKQRQMEQLNFRQAKLDFDGVDPDLGMHLLSLHWNRQHHSFLITYRPAFMRDMACNGPYFSKLLLNAIYFGAAKFSPRLEVRKDPNDVRTAGWRYRERVRELLGGALDHSDITTIQALLVMTNSLFALGDERSAAWLYSGLAFRMLIDMGMHVDLTSTHRFSDEDLEIRRRVFWGAFVVDKIQSLYQGRPVSLKDTDALVPIKFLDTYEELEHWQPFAYTTSAPDYPGMPAYSISTFTCLCKLSLIMSDILSCIYTERSSNQRPAELASMLDELQLRLDQWKATLPEHLRFDPGKARSVAFPPPHVSSLHAMHNSLVILLHRPFVADGHLYSTSPSISVDSFMKCASAASNTSNLLRAYHRAFSIRRAPYLISYATYVAATILTRIAAKRRHDSIAHANLATCLAVFKENQETNSAVKKAANIVQGLMKRLGVVIDNISLDALEIDPPVKSSERDPQPNDRATDGDVSVQPSAGTETHNSLTSGNVTGYSNTKSPGQPIQSPGSDWVDIDGIIQSFLHENSTRGARLLDYEANGTPTQLSRAPWMPLHPCDIPATVTMDNARHVGSQASLRPDIDVTNGAHRSETASGTSQWQYGWRPTNCEPTSLEDPLFGLNAVSSRGHITPVGCGALSKSHYMPRLWPDEQVPPVFSRALGSQTQEYSKRLPGDILPGLCPKTLRLPVLARPNLPDMATELVTKTRRLKRHALPCVLMRAGTSKGIFLHQKDLPMKEADWAPHLVSALGSRGNDPRQIDGVGGGTSTTSKVAVVRRSQRPDADIDWTFVQVAVGKESVDFTGTCGNMTAGVAPFAIQEGLIKPQREQTKMDVRIYNTNTDRIVIETVTLDSSGDYEEDGNFIISGVKTPGSEVKCRFVKPFGSMTGKLFPSADQQQQTLWVQPLMPGREPFDVRVTLIDSANPFVLIDTTSISATLLGTNPSDSDRNDLVESIRRAGAVAMGLATDVEAAGRTRGTPKAALVFPPTITQAGGSIKARPDIRIQAYSMGLPHPSLQLTGAVTIAVALSYPGTIVAGLSAMGSIMHGTLPPTPAQSPPPDYQKEEHSGLGRDVLIEHSQGTIKVDVEMANGGEVASCAVSRTARRLFEGKVRYYIQEDEL